MTIGDATPPTSPLHHDIGHVLEHLRGRWRWFAAFGLLTMFFGFVSLGVAGLATLVSVYLIAAFVMRARGDPENWRLTDGTPLTRLPSTE